MQHGPSSLLWSAQHGSRRGRSQPALAYPAGAQHCAAAAPPNPPHAAPPLGPTAGGVFIAWGIYVSYCVIMTYLTSSSSPGASSGSVGDGAAAATGAGAAPDDKPRRTTRRRSRGADGGGMPFESRPWYSLRAGPGRYFEPAFKLAAGLLTVCVELRFSAACHVPERLRWAPCWCGAAAAASVCGGGGVGGWAECWGSGGGAAWATGEHRVRRSRRCSSSGHATPQVWPQFARAPPLPRHCCCLASYLP